MWTADEKLSVWLRKESLKKLVLDCMEFEPTRAAVLYQLSYHGKPIRMDDSLISTAPVSQEHKLRTQLCWSFIY